MRRKYPLSVMVLTTLILIMLMINTPIAYGEGYGSKLEYELYLIDYGYIVVASDKVAYFEMPLNYSDGNLNQTVYLMTIGGNSFVNRSKDVVSVGLRMRNLTDAFMIMKIELSFNNLTKTVLGLFKNPYLFREDFVIPSEILTKYVRRPAEIVRDVVVKDFEKWLSDKGFKDIGNLSKAYIAVAAAYFIYRSGYIRYSPSAFGRTLEDVVKLKIGDCDDMSRVLMNLLWHYGIPAKIEYGYVYLPLDFPINVENSFIYFRNAGPHGYVVAYIPPLGWTSLDFLAGARMLYPVVVTGYDIAQDVDVKSIEEAKKFNRVNIYSELVELLSKDELRDKNIKLNDPTSIRNYALNVLGRYLRNQITTYLCKEYCTVTIINKTVTLPINYTITRTVSITHTYIEEVVKERTQTLTITKIKTLPIKYNVTRTLTLEITKTITKTLTKTKVKAEIPPYIIASLGGLSVIIIIITLMLLSYRRRY